MNIFITGGSGFLGKKTIKALLLDGHTVHALARSSSSTQTVKEIGAIPISGDLGDIDRFVSHLEGIDSVIHCAAPVEFWGPWEKYQRGIVDATIELAKASAKNNVKRFIHISSESVLQDKLDLLDIDESFAYPKNPNSSYGKAKKITEELLMRSSSSMEIIILRPTFIWGVGCPAFDTLSEKVASKQFAWIDQGAKSFEAVHVENVAESIRLALIRGKSHQIYMVTDDRKTTVREFFDEIFEALKLERPRKSLPKWLARSIAILIEFIWRSIGIKSPPPLTRFDVAFMAMARRYRIDRIKHDLGFRPIKDRHDGFREIAEASLQKNKSS